MPHRIVFTGKDQVVYEQFELPQVTEGTVRLRTECSLMSTGTEGIVLQRAFSPGTEWDDWVKYPFYPGYCCVGTLAEVGAGVNGYRTGDRVILRWGHASGHTAPASDLLPVPAGVAAEDAVWFALAKIAAMGARVAGYRLGDSVCVIGAGPVGQMSVRWAFASGVENIAVCDPSAPRLEIASRGGATAVIAAPAEKAREQVARACRGLPRVVVDTTGCAAVFATALSLCADRGTVVLLGNTGYPEQQHLTRDVVSRGVTITGAHDNHTDSAWNEPAIARLFFALLRTGRFRTDGLNTHTFSGSECRAAYDTARRCRDDTVGILFNWR